MATIYIGTVVSSEDDKKGGRIRARILPVDKRLKDSEIPYAFPLLPKMLHVMPKEGEAVCVICENDDFPRSQRFYIGPIISQPQFMYNESFISATSLLDNGAKKPDISVDTLPETIGAFPKDDDIAICGRKNGDIIISDDDIRIRCGVHKSEDNNPTKITFNKNSPAFIKLKYYKEPLSNAKEVNKDLKENTFYNNIDNITNENSHSKTISSINIVGDKINLISPNGTPYINTNNILEGISDEDTQKFIESAHKLPYGDELVKFLFLFLKMFKSHTHKYDNMEPCPDKNSEIFDREYENTEESIREKLLSKDISIN